HPRRDRADAAPIELRAGRRALPARRRQARPGEGRGSPGGSGAPARRLGPAQRPGARLRRGPPPRAGNAAALAQATAREAAAHPGDRRQRPPDGRRLGERRPLQPRRGRGRPAIGRAGPPARRPARVVPLRRCGGPALPAGLLRRRRHVRHAAPLPRPVAGARPRRHAGAAGRVRRRAVRAGGAHPPWNHQSGVPVRAAQRGQRAELHGARVRSDLPPRAPAGGGGVHRHRQPQSAAGAAL
ncbi:MAG: hypothetical protein AVDCRST_MAG31-453, partial [uncultured Sphingomonas sp.]